MLTRKFILIRVERKVVQIEKSKINFLGKNDELTVANVFVKFVISQQLRHIDRPSKQVK